MINEEGEEYIDASLGTFNLSLGYNHPYVVDKVKQQVEELSHMSSTFTEPYVTEVLDKLIDLSPNGIDAGWMRILRAQQLMNVL